MTDDKINKIEAVLAHQEQQVHDLNDIVIEQGKVIDHLQLQIKALKAKLEALNIGDNGGAVEERGLSITEEAARNKPPHY